MTNDLGRLAVACRAGGDACTHRAPVHQQPCICVGGASGGVPLAHHRSRTCAHGASPHRVCDDYVVLAPEFQVSVLHVSR